MSLPEVTADHRERAQRMWGCMFDVDDLAQMLANHEAEREQMRKKIVELEETCIEYAQDT